MILINIFSFLQEIHLKEKCIKILNFKKNRIIVLEIFRLIHMVAI